MHASKPWMDVERIYSIVEQTNALNADLIVLLGDFIAGMRFRTGDVNSDEWSKELSGMEGTARRACRARQSRMVG